MATDDDTEGNVIHNPSISRLQSTVNEQNVHTNPQAPHAYRRRRYSPNLTSETGSSEGNPGWTWTRRPSSDSGTEADDEGNGSLKRISAPLSTSDSSRVVRNQASYEGEEDGDEDTERRMKGKLPARSGRKLSSGLKDVKGADMSARITRRRRIEAMRRLCETALMLLVVVTVIFPDAVRSVIVSWKRELLTYTSLILGLYSIFPLRVCFRGYRWSSWRSAASFPFSLDFDPAPLIYPILLPVLVSLSLGRRCQPVILPNIMLSLSSLPPPVVPLHRMIHGYSISHWIITITPLIASEFALPGQDPPKALSLLGLDPELLTFLFPLQQSLLSVLQSLVTTSLLSTETQLLATGLINLLLFAEHPQAHILRGLLWLGGICVLVSCRHVLHWEAVLAKLPSWKFRRLSHGEIRPESLVQSVDREICHRLYGSRSQEQFSDSDDANGMLFANYSLHGRSDPDVNGQVTGGVEDGDKEASPAADGVNGLSKLLREDTVVNMPGSNRAGRQTHAARGETSAKTTPGGRRKRTLPPNHRSFLSLTRIQAEVRKWAYAVYAYSMILLIILFPIRYYVAEKALQDKEPFGWAIGYLFGNIPSLRLWLITSSLDSWVYLPPRREPGNTQFCHLGWVEHLRRDTLGEANTRLIICAYCLLVLFWGMALVFRLTNMVNVDTRRKIFHGMMVAMFLPTAFVDPAFTALAFSLVLAIFLLLELFRASQLPPISKPLTYFLAPYVDGRDHRGPVIVSHFFLLIGCSITLWLSLAGTNRSGTEPWLGWEIEDRDVSMVSGIICVGLGDAAASLVGRRYGRKKWFWGGGKSLEGSGAFAIAVFAGIVAARAWLLLGGWENTILWKATLVKAAIAAVSSSFTEAVVTGGNDNVVVPLVLWLLVRGLGI